MLKARHPLAIVFFPAYDWAISPTHPERQERLLYTQDQLREEGVFDIRGITELKPDLATAEDVLEFILVGATAVQVGTANFMRPDTAFRLVKDSEALARDLNLACWADLRGQLKV